MKKQNCYRSSSINITATSSTCLLCDLKTSGSAISSLFLKKKERTIFPPSFISLQQANSRTLPRHQRYLVAVRSSAADFHCCWSHSSPLLLYFSPCVVSIFFIENSTFNLFTISYSLHIYFG